MVVAAAVFALGMVMLPPIEALPARRSTMTQPPKASAEAPPAAAPTPAPSPAGSPPPATAAIAQAADAGTMLVAAAARPDAAVVTALGPARAAVLTPPATAPTPIATAPDADSMHPAREAAAAKADKTAAERAAERDAAKEAWRRNLPDISTDKGRVAILIPIRGSIEGATYHVITKPRAVQVILPQAQPLITMPYYKLKREGFRQLWIKQEDSEGTTLKVVLADGTDPQVEIKDDFVRVTIKQLDEADAATEAQH